MGLIKSQTFPDGVVCGYHRISQFAANVGAFINVRVESYHTSKADRDAGIVPYTTRDYGFDYSLWREKWEAGTGPAPADLYALIKTVPDFEGAEDELSSNAPEDSEGTTTEETK